MNTNKRRIFAIFAIVLSLYATDETRREMTNVQQYPN